MKNTLLISMLFLTLFSCSNSDDDVSVPQQKEKYQTKNVVILVIDAPRVFETWKSPNRENIPNRVNFLKQSVFVDNFQNNGTTRTNPGHSAIMTGIYESIKNDGSVIPTNPSMMQQWLKFTGVNKSKAWVITSKEKLNVLGNSQTEEWKDKFLPSIDCGIINTKGSKSDRNDSLTLLKAKEIIKRDTPNLLLLSLSSVDKASEWERYIKAIKKTDSYIKEVWDYLQSLPEYKDKTTLIVTNDHGRDANEWGGHGGSTPSEKSIEFLAIGPDFKKDKVISTGNYEQIDIASTVAELLQFPLTSKGKVMKDVFRNYVEKPIKAK